MDLEHKSNLQVKFSLSETNTAEMTFSGYAAYFDNIDNGGDVIVKGAFKASIAQIEKTGRWPLMLSQHGVDGYTPIGVWTAIREDEKGLYVEGKLATDDVGKRIYGLMKMEPRPAIDGMSIGYRVLDYAFGQGKNPNEPVRLLKSLDLKEISIVSFPMNELARVTGIKSVDARECEKALRDAGLSIREAKTAVSVLRKYISPRDEATTENTETRDEPKGFQDVIDGLKSLTRTLIHLKGETNGTSGNQVND